ncbi:DNA polymerase IV [Coprobacillus cateniformis]|uniref:DNA polymerase IV n=1 Tax=Coprobacillus cateniformis TaxID=100884 RepID=UPI0039A04B78
MQIIFHVDLNAFYASAETSSQPSLKGKPIVICGESRRSIITTASYEARKYGIHSAMPLFKAKELCPHLVIVPPHFELYKTLSEKFFNIISTFSQELEVASIDECYVDLTNYIQMHYQNPYDVAIEIQKRVFAELKLQCSIGIAPNKFLAKMASDMQKPMGITVITNQNYKQKIWPLPIENMFGIGKKTAPKLIELGIVRIGDLAKYENYEKIKPIFGKNALIYYQKANGKDYSKINVAHNELKSIGNSTTFERDSQDEEFIKSVFRDLAQEVSSRAKKRDLVGNSISITLKYTREKSKTKQMIIDDYTQDFDTIYATSLLLFESIYGGEMLRLVGISLNNVKHVEELQQQISLFDHTQLQASKKEINETDEVIHRLNSSLPGLKVMKASDLIEPQSTIQKKYLENNE